MMLLYRLLGSLRLLFLIPALGIAASAAPDFAAGPDGSGHIPKANKAANGAGYCLGCTDPILYVNKEATGNGDGSSWADAILELSDALLTAKTLNASNPGSVRQIWVAKGTYVPLYNAADNTTGDGGRDNAFVLLKDVQIYGGFSGDGAETSITDRDLSNAANRTILSGDLNGDDGDDFSNNSDNAYHVVISTGSFNEEIWEWEEIENANLNGFTIQGGNADGSGYILVNETFIEKGEGGGLVMIYSSSTMMNLIVKGNTAIFNGGGIYNYTSHSEYINLLITGNHADHSGGGFWNDSGGTLINASISQNTADNGAEVLYYAANLHVRNSIIWGNGVDVGLDASIISENSLIQGRDYPGNNLPGDTDPLFNDAANGDFTLAPNSPVINAGNNSLFTDLDANTKDLAGSPRLSGAVIDMGAYEFQEITPVPDANGILYVKKDATGSNEGSSWTDAIPELSDALLAAKTLNAGNPGAVNQIWVAQGTYVPKYNAEDNTPGDGGRDNAFVLQKNVRIFGGFRGDETDTAARNLADPVSRTILSGALSSGDNAYHVVISAGDVGNAALNGFTIQGGKADGGGAIPVNGTIIDRAYGGGICVEYSSLSLTNLIISGNKALRGGGISNMDSPFVLINTLVTNNEAGNHGGGIYNNSASYTPVLTNVTISHNSAADRGSEWYNARGIPIIRNSIIWGNGVGGILFDTQNSLVQDQANNGEYTGTGNNLPTDTDPLFADAANGDFSLAPNSPAIGAGDNSFFTDLDAAAKDLAGSPRLSGAAIDMGAYEFQHQQFTVSFNSGIGPVTETLVWEGDKVVRPTDPTNTGYTFGGWYKEQALSNLWDFATDVVTADITLYAKWTPNTYTITFESNDGSAVSPVNATHNSQITAPSNPVKPGYSFGGWYKEVTLNNAWAFDADVVTGPITLYAKWTLNTYTVTFESNGGSAVSPVNATHNSGITAPANPTLTGYSFGGWYKEVTLNNVWAFDADVVTGPITLYAKWTLNTYTVTFERNGGSPVGPVSATYNSQITAPVTPIRTGYTFDGWYKEQALSNLWDFATDVVTSDITLYAKWTPSILYVNAGNLLPADQQDGATWETAYSNLYTALNAAKSGSQKEIWVARGTYTTNPAADSPATWAQRQVYFRIPDGIALYGGFAGNEETLDERNFRTNPTVLSGEIGATGPADNSFHILLFDAAGDGTVLDGFIVQDGNANMGAIRDIVPHAVVPSLTGSGLEADDIERGGGASFLNGAAVRIRNTRFERNCAVFGGGAYIGADCSPVFENCYFRANQSNFGGGVYGRGMTASFVNVVLSGNHALGGALYLDDSNPELTNVTIAGNGSSDPDSRAVYNNRGNPVFSSSIIWGNYGGAITSGAVINFSTVQGGHAGTANLEVSPAFTDAFHDGLSPTLGGDYRLSAGSPAIDKGVAGATGLPDLDLDGNPRLRNSRVDMGAYENPHSALPVTLVYFKARIQEKHVALNWQTSSEVNASHFELQRSIDGKHFEKIAEQAAAGTGNGQQDYSHADYPPTLPVAKVTLYYRLKIIDNDGTFEYSHMESVAWDPTDGNGASKQIVLYPNPARESLFIKGPQGDEVRDVSVLGSNGLEILRTAKGLSGAIDVSGLSTGFYLVRVRFADGTLQTYKVLVER